MVFQKGNKISLGNKGGHPKVYSKEFILSLIPSLLLYANQPDSLNVNRWIGSLGLDQDRCSDFANQCEEFKRVLKQAKLLIGARRDELAMNGKIDSSMVRYGQHNYDPEHFESMLALKRAGREETTVNPPIINVHLSGRNGKASKNKAKPSKQ